MKENNIQDCIARIIEEHGVEIVHNTKVFYGMVADYASGDLMLRERRRIKSALYSGSAEILLRACDDKQSADLYFRESVMCLIDKTDMDEKLANEIMMSFAGALSIPVNVSAKARQTDASQTGRTYNPPPKYKKETPWKYVVIAAVVLGAAAVILLFVWPGNLTWNFWQWVIGIGGGLLIAAVVVFLMYILDAIGPEYHQSLSVMLTIAAIVNLLLLLVNGESYLIIALCYMVLIVIGGIITAFISFTEYESGYGIFNIALVIFNAGIFCVIVLGSYEAFCDLAAPVTQLLNIKK